MALLRSSISLRPQNQGHFLEGPHVEHVGQCGTVWEASHALHCQTCGGGDWQTLALPRIKTGNFAVHYRSTKTPAADYR